MSTDVKAEEEIRLLHGECADLLRTLDAVRRIVYDRLQSDEHLETAELLLAAVNAPAERSILQRAMSSRGRPLWIGGWLAGVDLSEKDED